jgi:opacity protein-like surface antigen
MIKKLLFTTTLSALAITHSAFADEEMVPVVDTAPAASSSALTLGVEALYLKADSEYGSGYADQDNEFAYRLSLAYQNGDSWGLRLRYFNFEATELGSPSDEEEHGPKVQSIDLEAFHGFALGSWQGEYSLGLRYFDLREDYNGKGGDVNYDGWGPVAGVELVRPFNDTLDFYINARVAFVFGDDDENGKDIDTWTYEAGAGIQYNLTIGNCDSHVRLGIEFQEWQDLTYNEGDGNAFGAVLGFHMGF